MVVAGHGGEDPGAIFPPNTPNPTLEEKNVTLPIALKLRDRLVAQDVEVVMNRTGDTTTTPQQRATMAEQAHARIFIAMHINSFYDDPSVRGVEAQYFSDPRLADSIGDGLVLSLHPFMANVRTTKDREQDNILSMPGAIIESGYLSNESDRQLMQSGDFQNAVAQGTYDGIRKYAPDIDQLKPQLDAQKAADAALKTQAAQTAGSAFPVPLLVALVVIAALYFTVRRRLRPARPRTYTPTNRYR